MDQIDTASRQPSTFSMEEHFAKRAEEDRILRETKPPEYWQKVVVPGWIAKSADDILLAVGMEVFCLEYHPGRPPKGKLRITEIFRRYEKIKISFTSPNCFGEESLDKLYVNHPPEEAINAYLLEKPHHSKELALADIGLTI